jgi:hypothetical protein
VWLRRRRLSSCRTEVTLAGQFVASRSVDRSPKQYRRSFKRVRPLARVSSPWAISLRALEERCTHEDIVLEFRSGSSKLIISPKSTPQERHDSDAVGCSSEPTGSLRRKSTVYGLNGHRANLVIALSLGAYENGI